MMITVKFFALLRDVVQRESAEVLLKEGATVADLPAAIGEAFPELRQHLPTLSFAVNNEYAGKQQRLHDGDEVALLPPISGG